jgi:hypothetical protein
MIDETNDQKKETWPKREQTAKENQNIYCMTPRDAKKVSRNDGKVPLKERREKKE